MPKFKVLTERFEVRLSPEMSRAAGKKARKTGKPLGQVIRELIAAWLDR